MFAFLLVAVIASAKDLLVSSVLPSLKAWSILFRSSVEKLDESSMTAGDALVFTEAATRLMSRIQMCLSFSEL